MRSDLTKILYDFGEGKYNENGVEIAQKKILSLLESKLPKEQDGDEYAHGYNTCLADVKKQLEIG